MNRSVFSFPSDRRMMSLGKFSSKRDAVDSEELAILLRPHHQNPAKKARVPSRESGKYGDFAALDPSNTKSHTISARCVDRARRHSWRRPRSRPSLLERLLEECLKLVRGACNPPHLPESWHTCQASHPKACCRLALAA